MKLADLIHEPSFAILQGRVLATDPFLTFEMKGKKGVIRYEGRDEIVSGDPFEIAEQIVHTYQTRAVIALSYDLKDQIESIPSQSCDELQLPDLYLVLFRHYAPFDDLEQLPALPFIASPTSHFTKEKYLNAVSKVIEHIRAGDIYQANLSQRFECAFEGDSFALYAALARANLAPMRGMLKTPRFSLISSSPECFLKREGNCVVTCPIKGTRPRGKTPEEDEKLKAVLWNSSKDAAELAMIIDLMRNDLGKLALPGSVRVTDPKRIESYANVHHLVATVEAQVAVDTSSMALIKACFPGGSITGCPKRRSMEIIEEMEPVKRGLAYGSFGFLDPNGDFDFNVLIRTLIHTNRKLFFHLGGGIVADSDSVEEYEETLYKGKFFCDLSTTF